MQITVVVAEETKANTGVHSPVKVEIRQRITERSAKLQLWHRLWRRRVIVLLKTSSLGAEPEAEI